MSLASRLYRGDIDFGFIASRKRWYAVSGILILVCIGSFVFRGFNFGIEFEGGSSFQINASSVSSLEDAEKAVEDTGHPVETAQFVGSGGNRSVLLKTAQLNDADQQVVKAALLKTFNLPADRITTNSVSSSWGHEVTKKAAIALVVFLILVIALLAVLFEPKMAVGAIIALLHDLVLSAGIYSLVGFEVTPSTIVGLLTILGFSLYDTVVVFDKVKENTRGILGSTRQTYSEAANLAVNQTLMRSINTSLIALLPVAGLLFVGAGVLGVGTLKDLALVLFVGLIAGAYSSIFIATPLVADLKEREPKYIALRKRVAARRAGAAKPKVDAAAGPSDDSAGVASAAADEVVEVVASAPPKPGARPAQKAAAQKKAAAAGQQRKKPAGGGGGRPQAKKSGGRPQAKRHR